ALGAAANVPHGHTSCVMLPHVMRYNEPVAKEKQKDIAGALGQPGVTAAEAVAQLIADLGQPSTLCAVGVKREQLGFIADAALKNRWVQTNPRPFSRDEMVSLLENAYD
ncbi:MAG TPA: iron-containing alcohol dehydrogenase, partial [Burkholderiales bacterium]|nr:iron-containing alcohol dehydrogenase [Burkholderiales bacterium]